MAEAMETEMDFSDGEQTNANRASLVALYGNNYSAIGLEKRNEHQMMPGYIFMCNGKTKPDCFRYRVFGIPRGGKGVVERIRPGMKLFLYDFEKRLLYGVYEATVGGKLDIEPDAFDNKYPAQVGFRIVDNCYPLPESTFKSAIYENYKGGKFNQELAPHQVMSLLSLFRPFAAPQLDALPHRFASRATASSRELSFEERFIAATQLKNASSVLDPLSARHAEPRLGSLMDQRQSVIPRSHHSYSRQDDYTTPVRETPSRSSSIQDPQLKYLTILSNIRRYGTAPEPLSTDNEYHPAMPSEKDQFASPYSDKHKYYLSTLPGSEPSSASAANGSVYRSELYTSASQKEGETRQQHETLAGTYYHPEASKASMQAVNVAQSHTETAGYPAPAHGEAPQVASGATDYAYKPQTVTGNYYTTAHSQPGTAGENAESYAGAVSYPPQQHSQLYAGGPVYTQQPHEAAYAQQPHSAATGHALQPHAATTGYSQQPHAATTGYSQQPHAGTSGYAQQSYDAATGYAQQPHAATTGYSQQPHAATSGYPQQSYDAATGYAQQPHAATTEYGQQPHAATTGYAQQPQDAATGYAQQPLDAAAGYAQQLYGQAAGYTTQPHAQALGYTTQYGAQAVGYTPQYGAQAGVYSQQAVAQGSIPGAPKSTDWNAASQAYVASQPYSATGDWNAMNQSYYHHTADTTTTYNQTS